MGAPPKKLENLREFIVALVIINFRSRLLAIIFLSIPNKTSVHKLLSCASSIIITEYVFNSLSVRLSLKSIPSVIYFIFVVFSFINSSNLIV